MVRYLTLDAESPQLEHAGKRFVRLCPRAELPVGSVLVVRWEGEDIAVFVRPEGVFAVSNRCAHQHVSVLAEGHLEGLAVRCPRHGWCYDLRTGAAIDGSGAIRPYELMVRDGWLYVECPSVQGWQWE
jgi:3-phenylpropionate/trans-cinnamate dioxygenase ferredoxin subunit